jgi:protein-tyrosine phosphatase
VFQSILVLCTGNICRSPIGEALLRKRLRGKVKVASAGVAALIGEPADPLAVEICQEAGLDIAEHRGQQATAPLLSEHELILTMAQSHNDWINRKFPHLRGRTHKLLRWRGNADIRDPFLQPRSVFEEVFDVIEAGVDDWIPRLKL